MCAGEADGVNRTCKRNIAVAAAARTHAILSRHRINSAACSASHKSSLMAKSSCSTVMMPAMSWHTRCRTVLSLALWMLTKNWQTPQSTIQQKHSQAGHTATT